MDINVARRLQLCLPIGYGCPRPGRFAGPMTFPQYKPVATPAMAAPVDLTGQETWPYHASSGASSESRTSLAPRYCPDGFQPRIEKVSVAPSWTNPDLMYSQYQCSPPQPLLRQTNSLSYPWVEDAPLIQEVPHELHDFNSLDAGSGNLEHDIFPADSNDPIDLSGYSVQDLSASPLNRKRNITRRSSLSTFSISSTEPITEAFEPSALSELPLRLADYTVGISNQSSTNIASPMQATTGVQHYRIRTGSLSRASPSSRPSYRTKPYSFDGVPNKPWSSMSCSTLPSRCNSPLSNQIWEGSQFQSPNTGLYNPTSALPTSNISSIDDPLTEQRAVTNLTSCLHHDSALPSTYQSSLLNPQAASSSSSQGFLNTLQSTWNSQDIFANHYSIFIDPPDLFAPLLDDQESPPPEDMKPSDPDIIPRAQELRFEVDLYTPRWIRGHGNKREGWCGICKPGRWLVLKNSAFWYDKSFTHGISAATGTAFEGPKKTRCADGNPDVWEGLCTSCGEWIALISSKKKGTTWFRHAYKCHTHPKVKDVPKKRRETRHGKRPSSASNVEPSSTPVISTPASTDICQNTDTNTILPSEFSSAIV